MSVKHKQAKERGMRFELHCCKLLSEWCGGKFKRVPLSGGWDKSIVTGDIFRVGPDGQPDQTFPFSVECKSQQGWNLLQLLHRTGPIFKWWKQCRIDADQAGKTPLLLFRSTGSGVLAGFNAYAFEMEIVWQRFATLSTVIQTRLGDRSWLHVTTWNEFSDRFKLPAEPIEEDRPSRASKPKRKDRSADHPQKSS